MNDARPHPISAEVWAGGRSLGDPRLSPDGELLGFVTSSSDRAELAVVRIAGEGDSDAFLPNVETWLSLDPPVKRGSAVFDWLPDGSGLVYFGADKCIHRFDFATHASVQLTFSPEPSSSLSVSPDGRHITYVVDIRSVFVASVDASTPPRCVSADADFAIDAVWSSDSQWIAWHEWDVPNMPWDESRIAVVEAQEESKPRIVSPHNAAAQQPRFSPDGRTLAFLCDAEGWMNVWTVDVPSFDHARALIPEEDESGGPSWGTAQSTYGFGAGGEINMARNARGRGAFVRHYPDGRAETICDGVVSSLHARGEVTTGIRSTPYCSGNIEVFRGSERRIVVRGDRLGIERAGVEPEDVEWKSLDGTLVHGRLYRAFDTQQPAPLLLWIHGGPHDQSMATLYRRWSYFLQRGWNVLVADYRGSSGWGRSYLQALNGRWGEYDVIDCASALQTAVERGWGDAKKLVPWGNSAGGFTMLHLLERFPELCAAGVSAFPVTDLTIEPEKPWRFEAHYTSRLAGDPSTYRDRSPLTLAAKITSPVLLMHGDSDTSVPAENSIRMAEAIERAGGTVELQIYAGEGHGWRQRSTSIDELNRIDHFLQRHVLQTTG